MWIKLLSIMTANLLTISGAQQEQRSHHPRTAHQQNEEQTQANHNGPQSSFQTSRRGMRKHAIWAVHWLAVGATVVGGGRANAEKEWMGASAHCRTFFRKCLNTYNPNVCVCVATNAVIGIHSRFNIVASHLFIHTFSTIFDMCAFGQYAMAAICFCSIAPAQWCAF